MNPSFRQIAELFNVVEGGDPDAQALKDVANGKSASESTDLGKLRLSEGDYQNAIRHFKEALSQRDTTDPDLMVDLAGAYDYGDLELQAYRQYKRVLRQKKESTESILGLADLLKRSGRFRDSVAELERAIRLEPGNAYLHIKLAEALRDMGEKRKALEAAEYAVVVEPDQAFYHFWIGELLVQMAEYERALQSFRAAIELSPGDDHLYLRAAVAFWRTDRRPEAIKSARLANDLDPGKLVYAGLLEALLREDGQTIEADLEVDRADKMDRYDRDIVARTLADMGIRNYDPDEA